MHVFNARHIISKVLAARRHLKNHQGGRGERVGRGFKVYKSHLGCVTVESQKRREEKKIHVSRVSAQQQMLPHILGTGIR
jgi:hypothetical protein